MAFDVSPAWGLGQSAIAAAAGLGGVLIGAVMTARNQKAERKAARIREQLERFYSPMLGMRAEIGAKTHIRYKISTAAGALWPKKFEGVRNAETSERISKRDGPAYDKILDYDNKQWAEVIIPLYRKMNEHFAAHMWLAAPSTLKHYRNFVEYVEMWDRHLAKAIPGDVVEAVGHSESELNPFYEDLQSNFDRLTTELGIR